MNDMPNEDLEEKTLTTMQEPESAPEQNAKALGISSLKRWMKQYKVTTRASTITNAFVSALAPYEPYDDERACAAMRDLGQNDLDRLRCVYCRDDATTWDHLINLVSNKKLNGYGHQLGNLVPCCSRCNSAKQGKNYEDFVNARVQLSGPEKAELIERLTSHLRLAKKHEPTEEEKKLDDDLQAILTNIQDLLTKADSLVNLVRNKSLARQEGSASSDTTIES